ncbi:hypothetical protein D477_000465 [Arthrobacter crystallopoietes BAB-32]|uniref:Uncharacterized protein n=1 Tax=Arthrobacter crystallopoietes BAB-32 TaxID=1246476 RepID=N1V841_9MICC|nr:hypothetical protein [Arthrobacter crystallopoietes]EMY36174.1 hypothetical protein D477_000465 [Arthrobacter crystallopoietes BAB-32]
MGSWDIRPEALHAVLADVAADGQSMMMAAEDAAASGEEATNAFGTASDVAAAFGRFWAPRKDVGSRAAGALFHKAGVAAETAQLYLAADGEMADAASTATAGLTVGAGPGHARWSGGSAAPVLAPFLSGRGFGAAVLP